MRRFITLPVFVMTLLILASGVRAQTASGKHGPTVEVDILAGAGRAQVASGKRGPMAKVGLELASLHEEYQSYVTLKGGSKGFKPSNRLLPVRANRVVIDAVASGDAGALQADLEALGMQNTAAFGRIVSGQLPIDAIEGMAGLGSLRFARPAYAMTRAGLVTSQGDVAMRSDVSRTTFGVDGTGVTVGTLSDSFNCLGGEAGGVASGDLPPGIVVLEEEVGCGSGSDEGRAMMELIHDVAPGANQAFHTAFNGQADFALGIEELAGCPTGSSPGCTPVTGVAANVINDDVIYFAESMFQDGIIAQAVDTVVASGVSYFSAAGNDGRNAYEDPFRGSGTFLTVGGVPSGELHDFDLGAGVDFSQKIDVPTGSGFILSFQWDDPFFSVSGSPGAGTDMNIYLTDRRNRFVLASSTTNNLSGDPVELLQFINFGGFGKSFNILITNSSGDAPGLMKYVRFDLGPGVVVKEFDTASGTIYGHANAAGAEAVGAAFYEDTPEFGTDPPLLESFSSAGPTPILFDPDGKPKAAADVRQKPNIVAPDGTNTTFFGSDIPEDGDSFPNFFGTSAAAPHAAAVAALMLDANPALTPTEVYTALEGTAIDMETPGLDFDSGFGFIQADLAVDAVSAPTIPTVTISATDPAASEAGPDPGTFTVTRTGSTAADLVVSYTVGGTATNGSDYTTLSNSVTIAAGSLLAPITITPIDDLGVEGDETVIITLAPNPAAYTIGTPASDTVTIADNDAPAPTVDVVTITSAEWRAAKKELKVRATSSEQPAAVLTVVGFEQMTFKKNKYELKVKPVNDPPGTVTVTSSLGGSDSASVTIK